MGNSVFSSSSHHCVVDLETAAEYQSGLKELYFKVIVWMPRLKQNERGEGGVRNGTVSDHNNSNSNASSPPTPTLSTSNANSMLPERWGLEIKDCKSGVLIAYFEYSSVDDQLQTHSREVSGYSPRQDRTLITGTIQSNLMELTAIADGLYLQRASPNSHLDPQTFVIQILDAFGLCKHKVDGRAVFLNIHELGIRVTPQTDVKLAATEGAIAKKQSSKLGDSGRKYESPRAVYNI
jgi:hypothetical protein